MGRQQPPWFLCLTPGVPSPGASPALCTGVTAKPHPFVLYLTAPFVWASLYEAMGTKTWDWLLCGIRKIET